MIRNLMTGAVRLAAAVGAPQARHQAVTVVAREVDRYPDRAAKTLADILARTHVERDGHFDVPRF